MAEELTVDEGMLLEAQEELVEGRPHREALLIAFSYFIDPVGAKWSITAREGADIETALEFASGMHTISEQLVAMGWTPQGVPWPPRNIAEEQEKRIAVQAEVRALALFQERVAETAADENVEEQVQTAILNAHKKAIAEYAVLIGLMSNTRDKAGARKLLQIGTDAGLTTDEMVEKHAQWLKALTDAAATKAGLGQPPRQTRETRQPAQGHKVTNGGGQIKFVQVKVVAKGDGSPIIEFWNPGRDYAEIRYYRSAESLLEMADSGFRDAFDEADLKQVGMAVPFTGSVHYVLSENTDTKGRPYKNISFVEST